MESRNLRVQQFQHFSVSGFQLFSRGTRLAPRTPMLLLRFRGFGCINRRGFISFTHISLMAGVSLATATLLGGSGYLIRELQRQATVASAIVGLPSSSADPSLLVPVSSDMFKVTAIALGATPAAIVNGKAVG